MKADPPAESLAGHYAGPVTRIAAYTMDLFLIVAIYGLLLGLVAFLWQLVSRDEVTLPADDSLLWLIGLVVWGFAYFAGGWILAAKTLGQGVLGLRVVRRDGAEIRPRQAVVRALTLPLGAVLFGLGYIGIVIGDERRALHDVCAGTTVVYDWDARAARWRLLSRRTAEA
jgi:uncharacterized RDD family membrane protein YckC